MPSRPLPTLLLLALAWGLSGPARADHPGDAAAATEVRLLPGWQRDDGSMVAGVEIVMPPGWHTYWREPGAAGIPPQFDWQGSSNLARAEVGFPHPALIESFGSVSVGYRDRIILPLTLTPEDPALPVDLRLDIFFGICDEICVPAERRVAARMSAGPGPRAGEVATALDRVPVEATAPAVAHVDCRLVPSGNGWRLAARIGLGASVPEVPYPVVETGDELTWVGTAAAELAGDTLLLDAPVEYYGDGGVTPDPGQWRLTLIGRAETLDIRGCPTG